MPADSLPLQLTLPSELRFLAVAKAFIESVCDAGRFDPDATDAIVAAMHEAISNVIRHAHRDRPEARLQIACVLSDEAMVMEILDEGEPFDVDSVPRLDPVAMRLGGRGVYLMRRLMDELSSRPREGGGNILRMVKRRSRHSAPSECN
jgi:serine/threonine-protein kinase RsbW